MEFKTQISGHSTTTIHEDNHKSEGTYEVSWQLYIEARDYGVKEISYYITNVKDINDTDDIDLTEENGWVYQKERVSEDTIDEGITIIPNEIIVDYNTKIITILFYN